MNLKLSLLAALALVACGANSFANISGVAVVECTEQHPNIGDSQTPNAGLTRYLIYADSEFASSLVVTSGSTAELPSYSGENVISSNQLGISGAETAEIHMNFVSRELTVHATTRNDEITESFDISFNQSSGKGLRTVDLGEKIGDIPQVTQFPLECTRRF